ncbi:hypothetical protein PVAP13_7KG031787 [Panicum virgatum]|uniref:Ubiquitin-like protease family profile domain-containing protein n=1 Tax=Panicum virgatum TaxID=38727 RepID=A0A8T0QAH3_PANVG|nr:hypothetical protein PVAP13_7KG031787 [Panicum virgatum]
MMKQAEEMHCNVGFLGPQLFSATVVQFKSNDVIQAIKKAMKHDFVVGAYNIGSHWVMVAIAMKWNDVWYLDSSKGFPLRKFKDVVTIVNWAFSEHMDPKMKKNSKTKPKLTHKIDIPCTQQPSGSTSCGFYVALNMYDLLGDMCILKKASANQATIRMIQGMLCEFILKEIIDPKGSFYDGPADDA